MKDRYTMMWRGDGVTTEEDLEGCTMSQALAEFQRAVTPVRHGTASLVCYPCDPKPYGPRVVVMTYVPDHEA